VLVRESRKRKVPARPVVAAVAKEAAVAVAAEVVEEEGAVAAGAGAEAS